MQEGRVAITPIHDKYLLVAYADNTADIGSIKIKVRKVNCYHLYMYLQNDELYVVQLEAAKRDLAEPLARVGHVSDDAPISSDRPASSASR
jgi:hypothetical protein